jgi:hypothetical protein
MHPRFPASTSHPSCVVVCTLFLPPRSRCRGPTPSKRCTFLCSSEPLVSPRPRRGACGPTTVDHHRRRVATQSPPFGENHRMPCKPKPMGIFGPAHQHTCRCGHSRSAESHVVGQLEWHRTEACTDRWLQWVVGIPCVRLVRAEPHPRPHAT